MPQDTPYPLFLATCYRNYNIPRRKYKEIQKKCADKFCVGNSFAILSFTSQTCRTTYCVFFVRFHYSYQSMFPFENVLNSYYYYHYDYYLFTMPFLCLCYQKKSQKDIMRRNTIPSIHLFNSKL